MSLDSVNNSNCENDYIEVTEIQGGRVAKSAKYCDSIPGIPFRSTGINVDVAFHSDGSNEDSGFKISYRAIGLFNVLIFFLSFNKLKNICYRKPIEL